MTSLTPFTAEETDSDLSSADEPGAALASLIDHLMEATAPTAFQVVFQRRASWQSDAEVRKEDLVDGRDTFFQEVVGSFLEVEEQRSDQDDRQLSEAVEKRIESIDAKNAKRSFTVNIRPPASPSTIPTTTSMAGWTRSSRCSTRLMARSTRSRGNASGTAASVRKTKEKKARAALQRLLNRELTTGTGRPVPSWSSAGRSSRTSSRPSEQLTVEGTRGTRAEQQSRNPLPWPNPDLIQQFQEGMEIGYALDENGEPRPDPIRSRRTCCRRITGGSRRLVAGSRRPSSTTRSAPRVDWWPCRSRRPKGRRDV